MKNDVKRTYEYTCPLGMIDLPTEGEIKGLGIEMVVDEGKGIARFRVSVDKSSFITNYLNDLIEAKKLNGQKKD